MTKKIRPTQGGGMRIERNHVYSGGSEGPKGPKGPNLNKAFQKGAPINTSSKPLAGRVTKAKSVTERGKSLSKEVGKITGKIPSPFLKSS